MFLLFFFNDTATTEIYTLSLHDALPIWGLSSISAASICWKRCEILRLETCTSSASWCAWRIRSEEHTSELQSPDHLVCRLLLEKKKHGNEITQQCSSRSTRE